MHFPRLSLNSNILIEKINQLFLHILVNVAVAGEGFTAFIMTADRQHFSGRHRAQLSCVRLFYSHPYLFPRDTNPFANILIFLENRTVNTVKKYQNLDFQHPLLILSDNDNHNDCLANVHISHE